MKDKNPTAVNILKLQRYNFDYFSLEEVIFFEYIIVKGRAFGFNQFYHSHATIQSEIGLKRNKLYTIIKRFKELGIFDVEIKGMPRVHHYRVDFKKIIELLPKIYQSAENGKLNADFYKLLVDFFQHLAEKYQQKDIKKNIKEEILKENIGEDSDWDSSAQIIFDFLSSLKYEKNITEKSLRADESLWFRCCQAYGTDVVLKYLKQYFAENPFNGSAKKFLEVDKIDSRKVVYIEKHLAQEQQYLNNFISKLNELYNERRQMASNTKRRFSQTGLVINENIKKQISEAMKLKTEVDIKHAFIAYNDAVIKGDIKPNKHLPYFLTKQFGEYSVIDTYLEYFNSNYSITK